MFGVLGKPAVHQCWAAADMSERQACIGATAVTPGCCQLSLQSSSEPESMFPVLGKPAVHLCWAFADLYVRQTV